MAHSIFEAYWVSPGRFLAGEYPDSWNPDADPMLRWLLQNGVSTFVDLTEDEERVPYLTELSKEADHLGIVPEYLSRPIQDMSTPTVEAMTEILGAIDAAVEAGKVVYVHCMAGLGRTGVVVGCYLVRHGMTGREALEVIPRLRGDSPGSITSPYTNGQRLMVLEWTSRLGKEASHGG